MSPLPRRSLALAALAAAVAPAQGGARAELPASCVPRSAPIRTGIHELSRRVSGRVVTLRLRSRAMAGVQSVSVLLPRGYDRSPRTRYRVLYLLHGAGGDNRSWLDGEHAERALGSLPVIAVMPDGSSRAGGRLVNGDYSDWFGAEPGDRSRPPAWESFHVRELVPFIDRAFRTRTGAAGRAIAGISMGGTGAMKYAAEFPGTFGYAASLSGGLDWLIARQGLSGCKWGQFPRDEVVWRDNDPTDLAGNLRGVRLFVRSGDGTPGPFDAPTRPADPVQGTIWQLRLETELGAHLMAEHFLAALAAAGIKGVDAGFYHGSHSPPYWLREERSLFAWLRRQFRRPPTLPRSFSVASAHESFGAWGFGFAVHRRVREFLYLKLVGGRLTATGSGVVDTTTPPRYPPGSSLLVTIGSRRRRLRADGAGRLHLRLDLGPSHSREQSSFGPGATRGWRSLTVRLPR